MPKSGHREQGSESAENHRIARRPAPGQRRQPRMKGLAAKQRKVQQTSQQFQAAEEARKEETKETAQFEHVNLEQAAAAEQEQKNAAS